MLTGYLSERDLLPTAGRESAICELRCQNCGDGLRFDQRQCATCGNWSPRFREQETAQYYKIVKICKGGDADGGGFDPAP